MDMEEGFECLSLESDYFCSLCAKLRLDFMLNSIIFLN